MLGSSSTKTSTLTVPRATPADAGLYECKAKSHSYSNTAYLLVNVSGNGFDTIENIAHGKSLITWKYGASNY